MPFTPAVAQLERFSRFAPFQNPLSERIVAALRRAAGLSSAAAGSAASARMARHFGLNMGSLVYKTG
jgi:hypothetical protein